MLHTHGGNIGGVTSLVWHKFKMVINICLIFMYQKVEPERDKFLRD